MDLESNAEFDVGPGHWRANWSPDSKSVVVNDYLGGPREYGMFKLSADVKGTPERLFPQFRRAESPCYSADGTKLVFIAQRPASDKK